jgi:hypothetical protein
MSAAKRRGPAQQENKKQAVGRRSCLTIPTNQNIIASLTGSIATGRLPRITIDPKPIARDAM